MKADAVTLDAPEGYKWVNGVLTAKNYVAQVGNKKFESLAEAIAAANGETVTLLDNASGDGIIIDKDVVIDLNGKTYTFNGTLVGSTGTKSNGFQILEGNTVIIKNGALVMDEAAVRGHDGKTGNNFVIQNYANLTLEDVSVKGNIYTSYVVSINSGNVALTGNTSIEGNNVAFDVCKYLSYAAPNVTVNTTGTITGKVEVSGGALDLQAATINGELVYISGSVVKAEAVTLDAPEGYKWVDGVLTAKTDCEINGHKYESETFNATCTENGKIVYTCTCGDSYEEVIPAKGHSFGEDGYCTVCGAENTKANFVAQIGDTKYLTLKAAIEAAEELNTTETVTIKLLKSTSGDALTITKDIKIVFVEGCGYTVNATEGASAAVTIKDGATLTLEGGTLLTRKAHVDAYDTLILNNGDLIVNDMTLKGSYLADDGQSIVIKNVNGNVELNGATTLYISSGVAIDFNGGTVVKEGTVMRATAPAGFCWNAEGELGTHNPTGATCLTAATCAHCGKTQGKALAHVDSDNDNDHICDTCDKIVSKHEYADEFATECRECGAVRTNAKDVVAMIGTEKFATLADAVKAAEEMNTEDPVTIELQMSARGEALTITKNIIINFNGRTYTVSDGSSTAAVTIEQGATLTLVGGTLGSRVVAGQEEKFDTLILNKGNLNTKNMTLRGNYLGLNQGVVGGAAYTVYNDGGIYDLDSTKIGQNTNCDKYYKIYNAA